MEVNSVKNTADAVFFARAICVAGATNSLNRRAKSDILFAVLRR